jgi:hypothetical protein
MTMDCQGNPGIGAIVNCEEVVDVCITSDVPVVDAGVLITETVEEAATDVDETDVGVVLDC